MKLLVDMNLSPAWIEALAKEGLEAVHWSTIGKANATDGEIMRYARDHDYVVLTHDLDFSAILAATNGEKPSVVQLRAERLDPTLICDDVALALRQMELQLAQGALLTIDPSRARLRLLPLRLQ